MESKFFKLINGLEIIAHSDIKIDNWYDSSTISIIDPVMLQPYRYPKGDMIYETFVMTPWVKAAKYDVITIPTKHIMLVLDIDDHLKAQYEDYILEVENATPVLSSSETAPESFEDFINHVFTQDDEDDEEHVEQSHGRTIH